MINLRCFGFVQLGPAGDAPDLRPASIGVLSSVASSYKANRDSIGDGLVVSVLRDAIARVPARQMGEVAVLVIGIVPANLPF